MNDPPDAVRPLTEQTSLVADGQQQALTKRRETDAHTALVRGLAEYLRPLQYDWFDGSVAAFVELHEDWPANEQRAAFPGGVVREDPGGAGGGYASAPIGGGGSFDFEDGTGVQVTSQLSLPIVVEMWCANKEERIRTAALLEDALYPHTWMAGVRLLLPHYFGLHATYLARTISYVDTPEDAQRGYFRLLVSVVGDVPVARLLGARPRLIVRHELRTTGTGAEVIG